MKKIILFCFSILLFSCNTDPADHSPVLTKVVIAPTQAMIDAGIDETEFDIYDYIRFHYTVTDIKKDYDKAVITIMDRDGEIIEKREDIYTGFRGDSYGVTRSYLPGKFTLGSWSISIYYLDKAGNKSKTVIKHFVVLEELNK